MTLQQLLERIDRVRLAVHSMNPTRIAAAEQELALLSPALAAVQDQHRLAVQASLAQLRSVLTNATRLLGETLVQTSASGSAYTPDGVPAVAPSGHIEAQG